MKTSSRQPAGPSLLYRLLDRYERSTTFGRPEGPDVVVRLDAKAFPSAWSPDGASLREALLAEAAALEQMGLVQIRRGQGYARDVPAEVRLSRKDVAAAYEQARAQGFVLLQDVLDGLAAQAVALQQQTTTPWMQDYLGRLAAYLRVCDLALLGTSASRLKAEADRVRDALTVATSMADGCGTMERILSERLLGDSKRIDELHGWIRRVLLRADPWWQIRPPLSSAELFAHYGIRAKPVFLYCAGGAIYEVNGHVRHLRDDVPSAAVAEGLVTALARGVCSTGHITITTIENETPYHLYVEERGGPAGLSADGEMVLYTGGFPNRVVIEFLATVAHGTDTVSFRHWGDADGAGLDIWWLLRKRIGRAVRIFRTTSDWILHAAKREARPLPGEDRSRLSALLQRIEQDDDRLTPDLREAADIIRTILSTGKWIEQERYVSTPSNAPEEKSQQLDDACPT